MIKQNNKQNKIINTINKTKNNEEKLYTIDYEEIEPKRIDRIIAKMNIGENLSFLD